MSATLMSPEQIAAYVDATAALLRLPLHADHRPGVLNYMALAAQMAALIEQHVFNIEDDT